MRCSRPSLCLALAYPLAALIARTAKKYRDLLLLLVILPFWSNFLIRIYAWMIILGPQAALARGVNAVLAALGHEPVPLLFSSFAVLVCLVYVHLPFMVLPLYANLEKHDQALLDAAQDLGANAWQRFWRITFPLSLPGVYAGAALVFIPALGIFAIPDILGGPEDSLIGNLIKQQFLETRDWPFGSVLSIVLTRGGARARGAAAWIGRGNLGTPSSGREAPCVGSRSALWFAAAAAYAFLYLPLVIVVVYSFNDSRLNAEWVGFTLDWYGKLFANEEMLDCGRQFAADRARGERSRRRCWGRWPGFAHLPLPSCACCRSWCWRPIAIPEILMGVSLLIFFVLLNFTLGLVSVALAHIAFCIGFVAIVVRVAARRHGREPDRSRPRLRRDAVARRSAT